MNSLQAINHLVKIQKALVKEGRDTCLVCVHADNGNYWVNQEPGATCIYEGPLTRYDSRFHIIHLVLGVYR